MSNVKDLYSILELDKNCTQNDIKRSYRRLALKYHPDKCKLSNAEEKFMDIHSAYQILSNPLERQKYNKLNSSEKIEFYDQFKKYILSKIPNIDDYIKIFFDDENNLKDYVEKMDLKSIYNQIMEKMVNINFPDPLRPIGDVNIYGKLTATFEERYMDKYRKIQVNRQTKPSSIFCIPLRESKIVLPNEGEYDRLINKHGDIIIDIELDEENDFVQMNNDIFYTKHISLHDYLYGGKFELKYFNNETLDIKFESFVEKFPLITVENKGMPVSDQYIHILRDTIFDINIKRGNLLIIIKIKNLDSLDNDIKNLCNNNII